MPLYEGIGLISEKHAVVLDVGRAYTKCGYAGESHPRCIIPTRVNFKYASKDELYDSLVTFIHQLYFSHLLVNPKDRRVVIVESILANTDFRQVLAKVLFQHFEVLSVLFAPSHLMPLFALGTSTALVLDLGFKEATLIPVYEKVPILKAWQAQPLASEAIHDSIRNGLNAEKSAGMSSGESQEISEAVIEDIKVRLCFTTNLERGLQIQKITSDASSVHALSSFMEKGVPSATYPLMGDRTITVDGFIRESACEVLFQQDNDHTNIATMILDAILTCPIDTRKQLAENIVLVGGTSMILGLKARLFAELKYLLLCEEYAGRLAVTNFKFHTPPAKPNYTCWLGASIFGATDAISTRSLTRDQYLKEKVVPDWADLRFNTLEMARQG